MLYWLANYNFFNNYTFIRKIQCNIFGHPWNCWITVKYGEKWCTWCGRSTTKTPNMRYESRI